MTVAFAVENSAKPWYPGAPCLPTWPFPHSICALRHRFDQIEGTPLTSLLAVTASAPPSFDGNFASAKKNRSCRVYHAPPSPFCKSGVLGPAGAYRDGHRDRANVSRESIPSILVARRGRIRRCVARDAGNFETINRLRCSLAGFPARVRRAFIQRRIRAQSVSFLNHVAPDHCETSTKISSLRQRSLDLRGRDARPANRQAALLQSLPD